MDVATLLPDLATISRSCFISEPKFGMLMVGATALLSEGRTTFPILHNYYTRTMADLLWCVVAVSQAATYDAQIPMPL